MCNISLSHVCDIDSKRLEVNVALYFAPPCGMNSWCGAWCVVYVSSGNSDVELAR